MNTKKAPQPSARLLDAVRAYLTAEAMRRTLEPVVRKIQSDLLDEMQIMYAPEYAREEGRRSHTGRIPNADHMYLASDDDAARYFAELDVRIHARFPNTPPEYCPLLMAMSAKTDAENLVMDYSADLHGEANMNSRTVYMHDDRERLIDLTVRYCVPFLARQ